MLLLLGSGPAWAFAPRGALTPILIIISLRLRLFTAVNFVARIDYLILEHGRLLLDRGSVVHGIWQRRASLFDDLGLLQIGLTAANLLVARTNPLSHFSLLQG